MKELIKVKKQIIGNEEINAVDAKELHKFLKIKTQFNDWILRRIKEYKFVNNSDYLKISDGNYRGIGKVPVIYTISIDMAKELSMVEKNEKGKQARKYFIECEKRAKQALPENYLEALKALTYEVEQKEIAIKTKAHINNKKTATAMVTASNLKRENNKLKIKVDESESWKTVKAISWLEDYFDIKKKGTYSVVGRYLSKLSKEKGIETKSIPSVKYPKGVKTYPVNLISDFKQLLDLDYDILLKYRKAVN